MSKHRPCASSAHAAWLVFAAVLAMAAAAHAGVAARLLPRASFAAVPVSPIDNAAFAPGADARPAPPFHAILQWQQAPLLALPALKHPQIQGRDAQRLPALRLELFTQGDALVPLERGMLLAEQGKPAMPSYWSVIAQPGKVWREKADGDWSRAAFVIMLVNDTENHAHQGIATFLYRGSQITQLRLQFVQQSAPYLLHQHFVAFGKLPATATPGDAASLALKQQGFAAEMARRLPARPWAELTAGLPAGTLDGFGAPLARKWQVIDALVRDGTLYYQPSATPYGDFPYPLEMRFGVRSITKSVFAPLALLRLAQLQGPAVLDLHPGDFIQGLPPGLARVRFGDLANMTSGFGGTGTFNTQPNDGFDGYLGGDYDGWYTAPTRAEKLARISQWTPYPWAPGTVWRYRDQDFFLLGAALDAYLKTLRGPDADLGNFVMDEVLRPIGIAAAPTVRTREAGGRPGLVWCNAGYYPTLDDLAKIALLYQRRGEHEGVQLLHRGLTEDLMAARGAVDKTGVNAPGVATPGVATPGVATPRDEHSKLYRMGFHYTAFTGSKSGTLHFLPTMSGSGDNEVILYPNGMVSLRMAKAAELPAGEIKDSGDERGTPRAVDRLEPF